MAILVWFSSEDIHSRFGPLSTVELIALEHNTHGRESRLTQFEYMKAAGSLPKKKSSTEYSIPSRQSFQFLDLMVVGAYEGDEGRVGKIMVAGAEEL
jgi:hypothetical protein